MIKYPEFYSLNLLHVAYMWITNHCESGGDSGDKKNEYTIGSTELTKKCRIYNHKNN